MAIELYDSIRVWQRFCRKGRMDRKWGCIFSLSLFRFFITCLARTAVIYTAWGGLSNDSSEARKYRQIYRSGPSELDFIVYQ